ncbi:MAG: YiiX/YebB-like N1pC/P60 family cysteine hydrolase [Opitutaceae bacterium]
MNHVSILLASAAALPRREALGSYIEDVAKAEARGYFLPDEDERLREIFSRYLAVRTSLLHCLADLSRGRWAHHETNDLKEFAVAYAAACLLVRAASYLVELTENAPITRKKLDEPEPRFHIEAKQFTNIYSSLTSPRRWWGFFDATSFYQSKRDEIHALAVDTKYVAVVDILKAEEGLIELRRDDLLKKRLSYRLHSFLRRNHSGYKKTMFSLFQLSGSSIAELKQPFVKPSGAPKRVDDSVRAKLETFLKPGDVIVTRHDDALSNLFLPGFWPHAAFYIGSNSQRSEIGVSSEQSVGDTVRFLESKRDGVLLRPADDTLQVDAFVVLRPTFDTIAVAQAIARGLTHAGKLYDFIFDFTASDRLACTELVYRSFHSVGPVEFELQPHAGRNCLSAEDLINQAIGKGWFEPVLLYGLHGDHWVEGEDARELLRGSFDSAF